MIPAAKTHLNNLHKSTFFMNAFYLMVSTFATAFFGFLFWVIITKTYDATAVGLATALLSASGLLSLLGLVGFDTTFVRFLPGTDRKNDHLNSGFAVVALASMTLAVCWALVLPLLSPSLSLLSDPLAFTAFVFFTVITSLNVLTNAVFLAFKRARYIFVIALLFSGFKVTLPLLVAHGSALTIFVLAGSAQLVGLVLNIVLMKLKFGYQFSPWLRMDILRVVKKFSFSVYVSSIMNLLPPTLLPLIIVHYIDPAHAAYYYMAFTLTSVLYTIAYASMQSAFAEGSHNEAAMGAHMAKAAKFLVVLLVPAALLTALLSNFLLTAFGSDYAREAGTLLQLFALGALPVAVSSAMGAIFKVTRNLRGMVSMNIAYAITTLGLSYLLVPAQGLLAIGWAWIIGNMAACSIGGLFLLKTKQKRQVNKVIH